MLASLVEEFGDAGSSLVVRAHITIHPAEALPGAP
jgi:hypothetical protein